MKHEEIKKRLREGFTLSDLSLTVEQIKLFKIKYKLPTLNHKFGVEWEFMSNKSRDFIAAQIAASTPADCQTTGYSSGSAFDYWSVKNDASLSISTNEERFLRSIAWLISTVNKCELVSPPLQESDIGTLYDVLKVLNRPGNSGDHVIPIAYLNETCSTHVHISVEGVKNTARKSIFHTFQAVESQLEEMIKDKRIVTPHSQRYVRSISDLSYEDAQTTDKYTSMRINGNNRDRNGKPKTFEYRKMNGTRSAYLTVMWVRVLQAIHEYGKRHNVRKGASLNLYDVLKNPILWDFYNFSKKYLYESGYKKVRVGGKSTGGNIKPAANNRPARIIIGTNV